MKGIIFTEFLDLVESKFGLEMVDKIVRQSELESGGSYTNIGTYKFSEMLSLLKNLSDNTGISIDDLLYTYAVHFFSVLEESYSGLLNMYTDPIELLSSIENHIHVEVKKIYPESELPTFIVEEKTATQLVMLYKSSRAMYSFGRGLMDMTFKHFNSEGTILMEKIKDDGTEVRFRITKHD